MSNPTDRQIKAIENVIAVIESIRKNLGTGTWSQIYVAMANLIEPEYQIALDNVIQALKETAVTLKNESITQTAREIVNRPKNMSIEEWEQFG